MYQTDSFQPLQMTTNCGSLLIELQKIWDEVGEEDDERDKMISELEQECLDAYRRKVKQASHNRAQLRHQVADSEAQLADICAALGDRPPLLKKTSGSLKKELEAIMPQLEAMQKKRNVRLNQFQEVLKQINCISKELSLPTEENVNRAVVDEGDLSFRRLDELQTRLLFLQNEKAERLEHVLKQLNTLKSLSMVLGMDFRQTIHGIHPTLDDSCESKSVTAETIESLSVTMSRVRDVKLQRLQKLQDLAMDLVELWNLMDTPVEEQQQFHDVTRTIAASEHEITNPNSLSLEVIKNAEGEIMRLRDMKSSVMKEIVLKKKVVLEEICRGAHMVVERQLAPDLSEDAVESGILEVLEDRISAAKEEAFSRKEILEKVQKWLAACEEECWLEEYNRDDNRYNAGRGTHLMLKRAEKARVLVNKIPGMVEILISKVKAWEKERDSEFLYDGVGLLSMVEQYSDLKHLKEQERQRQRGQKKLQGQLMTEQEALFGSKPSPTKSVTKNYRPSMGGVSANKRFSIGGAMLQNTFSDRSSFSSHSQAKHKPVVKLQNSRFLVNSSGKRNTPGNSVMKRNPTGSQQIESTPMRKPLSPISSLSSNIFSYNIQDNQKMQVSTPKRNVVDSFENRTPKTMHVPVPATPQTMQTAMTPYTPGRHVSEEIEYSFEEKRAGFILPDSVLV